MFARDVSSGPIATRLCKDGNRVPIMASVAASNSVAIWAETPEEASFNGLARVLLVAADGGAEATEPISTL